jgi:hypothetical protein
VVAIVFGVLAVPKAAAGVYLFVAARGALVPGEAGRFDIGALFRSHR